jgi:hypothetical protein
LVAGRLKKVHNRLTNLGARLQHTEITHKTHITRRNRWRLANLCARLRRRPQPPQAAA